MGDNPQIKVVIPHYGSEALLDRCLDALAKVPEVGADDVIIIDNNSENIFFTRAVNHGIEQAMSQGADYIWLLNNDTQTTPDYVKKSLQRFEKSPDAGIVAGKNLALHDPDYIYWGGSGQAFPAGIHKMGSVSKNQLSEASVEPWATFSSALISREVFEEIGLLDPELQFIFSDSDFCFRARLAGFQIWYEPSAIIYHEVGASADPDTTLQSIMDADSRHFFQKWAQLIDDSNPHNFDQKINSFINGF